MFRQRKYPTMAHLINAHLDIKSDSAIKLAAELVAISYSKRNHKPPLPIDMTEMNIHLSHIGLRNERFMFNDFYEHNKFLEHLGNNGFEPIMINKKAHLKYSPK